MDSGENDLAIDLTGDAALVDVPECVALRLVEEALVLENVDAARRAEAAELSFPLGDETGWEDDDDRAVFELVVCRDSC